MVSPSDELLGREYHHYAQVRELRAALLTREVVTVNVAHSFQALHDRRHWRNPTSYV